MRTSFRQLIRSVAILALLGSAALAQSPANRAPAAAKNPARPAAPRVKPWEQLKIPALAQFKPQMPRRLQLENGLVIFLQEDRELPLIEGFARIRGGSREEPAEKVGMVSNYGTTWRTGGTKTRTGDELDDFLERRAAKVETSSGIDSTYVSWSSLKGDFDEVLKVVVELMRQPEFREDKIALAKQQTSTAISRRNDDANNVAQREATKLAYGAASPYARTAEYWTIAAITRQDLLDWHKRTVHPNNMLLGVVGDFDAAQMEARLREIFGSWEKGPQFKSAEIEITDPRPGVYLVTKDDVNQTNLRMVHLGIRRDNPDYFALQVMNEILGGGFVGRLMNNIRTKKGLAYGVGGGVSANYDRPGLFSLSMGTKSQTTVEAIQALYAEIDGIIRNPGTEMEVRRAKDVMLNRFVFNYDSKDKIMAERMSLEFFGYPADLLEQFQREIAKVTPADVARVAGKYVHKDKLAVLVVGKPADFDKPLDSLGLGTPKAVDITIRETPGGGAEEKSAPAAPGAAAQSNPEGRALIAKVIEGMGGKARVQAVKAMRTQNELQVKTPQGDMDIKAESTTVYPDRSHVKLQTAMGEMIVVIGPQASFRSMGGQVQEMAGSMREDYLKGMKREPVAVAQHADDAAFQFVAGASEKVGGTAARVLDITADGVQMRWWVDPATGHILRSSYKGPSPQGPPAENVITYSDWKEFDGLTLPTKSTRTVNGTDSGGSVTTSVVVNPEVDPKLFEKPPAK